MLALMVPMLPMALMVLIVLMPFRCLPAAI
jgi:hypothetical protein